MSLDIDKQVLDLMNKVKAKRAQIAEVTDRRWTTTCSLQLPGWERLNLQTVTDVETLALAFGTLRQMADAAKIAAKELPAKVSGKWQNYPIADWLGDIQQRVRIIGINDEKKKLKSLEEKLNGLTSEEQRRMLALADIEKELAE